VTRWADLLASGRAGPATLAGTVIGRKERTSAKGGKYAFVQLSDTSGVYEITAFSEILAAERQRLEAGVSLLLQVTAQVDGEAVRCVVQRLEPLERAVDRLADGVEICVDGAEPLTAIAAALGETGPGRGQVRLLAWLGGGREAEIVLPQPRRITADLVARLRAIPGVRDVRDA
ncbi:MAG TPA: OB-fold nucleic acid binding domain-containing protein, partial [Rhodospirillales bacterium]|nr:OB-fold nucleic acid binding domain-containing protein [Rhodospirillales bacterium]